MSTERLEAVEFPSKEKLLSAVKAILEEYKGTVVTVRQLYYRLVAAGVIPNNFRAYKNVGAALTKWRRDNSIPLEAFEDRTRGMLTHDTGEREDDAMSWMDAYLRAGIQNARNYRLARWFGQPKRVLVAVEKQALEGPFNQVCSDLGVDLAVCRGYPSLSFLAECALALERSHDRENVVIYFGDFDPSGLDIARAVKDDLAGFFGQDVEFHRIALTRDQADEMNLIPAPVKTTDTRSSGFRLANGDEVFELDAIPPNKLQQLIEQSILNYFDDDIFQESAELTKKGRAAIDKKLREMKVEKFLDSIKEGSN